MGAIIFFLLLSVPFFSEKGVIDSVIPGFDVTPGFSDPDILL
jgi:hypothetical protein